MIGSTASFPPLVAVDKVKQPAVLPFGDLAVPDNLLDALFNTGRLERSVYEEPLDQPPNLPETVTEDEELVL